MTPLERCVSRRLWQSRLLLTKGPAAALCHHCKLPSEHHLRLEGRITHRRPMRRCAQAVPDPALRPLALWQVGRIASKLLRQHGIQTHTSDAKELTPADAQQVAAAAALSLSYRLRARSASHSASKCAFSQQELGRASMTTRQSRAFQQLQVRAVPTETGTNVWAWVL